MMKGIFLRLFCVGLSLCAATGWAASVVTVQETGSGRQLRIEDAQNLAQLVTQPALRGSWWPGALIATPAAAVRAQCQYRQVMQRLAAWRAVADEAQAASIDAVIRQLKTVRVAGRLFVSLDPDRLRAGAQNNPRLAGDYQLYVGPRPRTITLMGAIADAGPLAWRPGATIQAYLQGHALLSGAEKNVAVAIDPDGSVRTAPVAYWNARHCEILPGGIIWVGFSPTALPAEFAGLNRQIVAMLTRRIAD